MTARPLGLLAAGATLGAVVAAVGAWSPSGHHAPLPADAVARVNGVPISRAAYHDAVTALTGERRDGAADPALRRHVLDRLIDEELLVQRGLALGLVRLDARVRADLVAAVLASIDAEAELLDEPDDAALAALLADQPERFRTPPRLAVTAAWFGGEDGQARGRAARGALADRGWNRIRADADRAPIEVPAGSVPVGTLLDVLGPTATRAALTLPVGAVSDPVVTGGGAWLVRVEARDDGAPAPLAQARPALIAEWRRQAGDRRLRDVLDDERRAADVVVASDAVADAERAGAARATAVGAVAGERRR